MFAHYVIPYRSVDLDSVAYKQDNKGGNIRASLRQQTGQTTIPQIYIAGQHIGGGTECFDAAKDGTMAKLLLDNNVAWQEAADLEPYSFLPKWLHPR